MPVLVGAVIGLLILPIGVLSELTGMSGRQSFVSIILGSIGIFIGAFVVTTVLRRNAGRQQQDHVAPRPAPAPQPQAQPTSSGEARHASPKLQLSVSGKPFEFEIVKHPVEHFRLYILKQPPYGQRSDSIHDTHRYYDGNRRYVCIDKKTYPNTLHRAAQVARVWAQLTIRYIETGQKF